LDELLAGELGYVDQPRPIQNRSNDWDSPNADPCQQRPGSPLAEVAKSIKLCGSSNAIGIDQLGQ